MAGFCTKCFAELDENGLCPVCSGAAPAPSAPQASGIPEAPITQVLYEAPEVPAAPVAPAPKFCMKCGNGLDENGLCPVCDAPPAPPAPKFCMKCGGGLDENGNCPVCDAPPAPPAPKFCMKCGGGLDENGLCPVCDAPPVASLADMAATAVAVEEAAEETAEVAPAEDRKPKKKVSALSVIATVLLSICLFITMLASVGVLTVRNTISAGGVANLTEELDVAELLKSTGQADGDAFGKLYERLERDHGIVMDDEKLGELLEESTVPAYVSEKAGEFTGDFFSGDAELVITKDEMVELVKENRDLLEAEIAQEFGDQKISNADCQQIADWMFNGDEIVLISTDDLQDSAPVIYQTVNIGLSWVALAFFLLLSALIGFVMCRNSLSQAAIGGGVVFILLGGITSIATAIVAWIPGLWTALPLNAMILSLVGAVLKVNILIFGGLLLLGVLFLVARSVVKAILRKKNASTAQTA